MKILLKIKLLALLALSSIPAISQAESFDWKVLASCEDGRVIIDTANDGLNALFTLIYNSIRGVSLLTH